MNNAKMFYFSIAGSILNLVLVVYNFLKINAENSQAIEYLQLSPYALMLAVTILGAFYAAKPKSNEQEKGRGGKHETTLLPSFCCTNVVRKTFKP